MAPKVLHLSTFDANGGAARAATALQRAMCARGVDSTMLVGRSDLAPDQAAALRISAPNPSRYRVASSLDHRLSGLQRTSSRTWRSPARFGSLSAAEINASDADIVNLHWVTAGFLTVETIGRIEKPIVWSHVDMWPFCGTEHYAPTDGRARWRTGYTPMNQLADDRGIDLDRRTWQRKLKSWRSPMHLAPASAWLAQATAESALMGDWPITRIPHVIDTDRFSPRPKEQARRLLAERGITVPSDAAVVLFLSSGGITDLRKGWDLLTEAIQHLRRQHSKVTVIAVGPTPEAATTGAATTDAVTTTVNVPICWAGPVSDDGTLAALYNAADVVAVPSRDDNMPLTAMEAMSCGRPVVAFSIGGLPDLIEHQGSGYLASAFDTEQFADGLRMAIDDSRGANQWGEHARERAERTWSGEAVVTRYLELYDRVLA